MSVAYVTTQTVGTREQTKKAPPYRILPAKILIPFRTTMTYDTIEITLTHLLL